ncbi:MAG: DUF1700 domain-containing protein [Christensenellaceae bacterium]|jgi:uncharacterized membrane protein|nr:DUF1700 domain-containing protein [Christensenellaceae bacterium]
MMTKQAYLDELRQRLAGLNQEEIDSCIQYYAEYFDEAGPDAEAEVISRLGTPVQVVAQVRADRELVRFEAAPSPKRGLKTLWLVILGIFASPIALPIAIALFAVLFAVLIALFAVLVALGAAALSIGVSGLALIVAGIAILPTHVPTGLFMLGCGLLLTVLGALAIWGVVTLGQVSIRGIIHLINKSRKRKAA